MLGNLPPSFGVIFRNAGKPLGVCTLTLDRPDKLNALDTLANSWFTNFAVKRLLIETDGMSLAEGLAHEHYRYPGCAPDHQQRIAAFRRS